MQEIPYTQFDTSKLILRDHLAIDRTHLANERTLLAYLRSAVAMLIAGLTIIQFFYGEWLWAVGVVSLPIAVITAIVGVTRYLNMSRRIAQAQQGSTVNKIGQ